MAASSPSLLFAWEPGNYPAPPARMDSAGFSVDTSDRNDVVAFWHAVYMASEGYQSRINWTGTYTSTGAGAEGTTSPAFVADVERRVNFFRAMAGLPADVSVNSGSAVRIDGSDPHKPAATTHKSAAAQRAAYVVAMNNALFHNPPTNFVAWTAAAWNGSHKGNLASGVYGPGAITEYLREELGNGTSGFNSSVGHRRWILYPQATDFATGDVVASAASQKRSANCLYVIQHAGEERGGLEPRFVSYPSPGYFPAPVNSRFWSLSYPNADFTNATVSITDQSGSPVAATVKVSGASPAYGDRAIAWEVGEPAATDKVTDDVTFHVTVSGIRGPGVPDSHRYAVTLINPNRLSAAQSLTGTPAPATGVPANYFLKLPPQAEAGSVTCFRPLANTWLENAETALEPQSRIIASTATTYPFLATATFAGLPTFSMVAGLRSYRLTFPYLPDAYTRANIEQSFEVDRQIVPEGGATFHFRYKRGLTTPSTGLAVETSEDDGASWTTAKTLVGRAAGSVDAAPITESIFLPPGPTPVRVRFRLFQLGDGSIYAIDQNGASTAIHPTGFFLDDFSVTGGEWLDPKAINELLPDSDRFTFNGITAGTPPRAGERWALRMRTKLGNRWFQHGPVKSLQVTSSPATGYDAWVAYEYPVLTQSFSGDDDGDGIPNGVEYAFLLDPLVVSPITDTLEIADEPTGQLADGSATTQNLKTGTLTIRRPLPAVRPGIRYGAEWSDNLIDWLGDEISINTSDGAASATAPRGDGQRFLRWKIEKE